ncbi:hypothetical protein YT1_3721 [Rhodococcus ruber]|nr:hypothetical protein YT1_3721 [Rhodococcus ruber]
MLRAESSPCVTALLRPEDLDAWLVGHRIAPVSRRRFRTQGSRFVRRLPSRTTRPERLP